MPKEQWTSKLIKQSHLWRTGYHEIHWCPPRYTSWEFVSHLEHALNSLSFQDSKTQKMGCGVICTPWKKLIPGGFVSPPKPPILMCSLICYRPPPLPFLVFSSGSASFWRNIFSPPQFFEQKRTWMFAAWLRSSNRQFSFLFFSFLIFGVDVVRFCF